MRYTRKTKNKKRKTKNKNKKGGQIITYAETEYRSTHAHTYDCGPSVFYLLGYCDEETAQYMASVFPEGVTSYIITSLLNKSYNSSRYNNSRWLHITGEPEERLAKLRELIPENHATIGSYGDDDGGHYFAVYNKKNNFKCIDPQQEFQGPLFHMLSSAEYLWDSFYIVVSDLKTDKKHLVTRAIIDQVRAEMSESAENFASASEEIKAKFVPRPVP
jgi:hypothetical protein